MKNKGFYTAALALVGLTVFASVAFTSLSISSQTPVNRSVVFSQIQQDWINVAQLLDIAVSDGAGKHVISQIRATGNCSLNVLAQGEQPINAHLNEVLTYMNSAHGVHCQFIPEQELTIVLNTTDGTVQARGNLQCTRSANDLTILYSHPIDYRKQLTILPEAGNCTYSIFDEDTSQLEKTGTV